MIGDAYIIGPGFAGAPAIIQTFNQYAGAIGALFWHGIDFIDHYDHGRELQTSVHYGAIEEDEAGTRAGSQSQLLAFVHKRNVVITKIRPALYYGGGPSPDTIISKRVQVGWGGFRNVIDYQTSVKVTALHSQIAVEAPTAYMPGGFDQFYSFALGKLRAIPTPNLCCAYSKLPLLFVNPANNVAMGVVAATRPTFYSVGSFGGVSKWSVTYVRGRTKPGVYSYDVKIALGPTGLVEKTMNKLEQQLGLGAFRAGSVAGGAAARGTSGSGTKGSGSVAKVAGWGAKAAGSGAKAAGSGAKAAGHHR
jgi:hypothetical protein